MKVPLLDIKAQYDTIREQLRDTVLKVLDSQAYINGPEVAELERRLAEYCDCTVGVGVSSGTDALLCSLMTLGIGSGHEVITTPYTFFATAGSIWRTGARPVFVDIDPKTFNIDTTKLEDAVTERTRAIMPVHLFGQMADMTTIMQVAARHDLVVIEDACQAIGATHNGQKAGSVGTVGCFSFYPSKNLGGIGDGGMIVTADQDLGQRLAMFRNHGNETTYYHTYVGGNFRLDTIQAAALLVKLDHLDKWSAGRRANAARYNELFAEVEEVTPPVIAEGNLSVFNQYVVRVPKRDELRTYLNEQGIGSSIYYPLSLHQQKCFECLGYDACDFPESRRATNESLALPIYAELTDEQLQLVAATIKQFYAD